MIQHWGEQGPPVYVSVASYLGLIGKRNKARPKAETIRGQPKPVEAANDSAGNLNELVAMFRNSGGNI